MISAYLCDGGSPLVVVPLDDDDWESHLERPSVHDLFDGDTSIQVAVLVSLQG